MAKNTSILLGDYFEDFIFYKINDRLQQIEIIRILHQQMDIDFHINE